MHLGSRKIVEKRSDASVTLRLGDLGGSDASKWSHDDRVAIATLMPGLDQPAPTDDLSGFFLAVR